MSGYRLPKPATASNEVYKLMLDCWKENPKLRPTFKAIRTTLGETFDLSVPEGYVRSQDK